MSEASEVKRRRSITGLALPADATEEGTSEICSDKNHKTGDRERDDEMMVLKLKSTNQVGIHRR